MGVTYRGQHSSSFGLTVRTDPSLLPDFQLVTTTLPNRPGAYYQKTNYGVKTISLDVGFVADSLPDYSARLRALANWLRPDLGPGELINDNEPEITYIAVLSQQDIRRISGIARMGQGTLTFICPDPFGLGKSKTITLTTNPIVVEGTRLTWPTIQADFTSAASSFKVTNQKGKYLNIIYNFAAGDQLILDFAKRKITINGIIHMTALDWANSEWFALYPGENTLTVSPTGVATVKITYTEKWL